MPLIQNEAYVTLVTSDSYVVGAGVLARSLQSTGTVRSIWCLAASKNLSVHSLEILRSIFDGVTEVDCLDSKDKANLALLGRPELGPTFTKLHLWRLNQFRKVVFLDADTLVMKNIDDLFEREEFSACADVGWPDCFNSGVFVAVPKEETFKALTDLAEREGSFDGGDQGLLNAHFSDWSTGPSSRRIPFTYNLTINASYSYAPAYARFKHDIKVVHFIGTQKPWTYYRLSDGSIVPRGDPSLASVEFIQMWWNVFDELSKSLEANNSISFMPTASSGSSTTHANDFIKYYPSNSANASSQQTPTSVDTNGLTDFASYRIKWSADVEKYFNSTAPNKNKSDKITTSPTSSANPLYLGKNLRHPSHQQKQQYRTLNGSKDEDEHDGRSYSDD